MDVVYRQCCGLDVHQKSVVACVMKPKGKESRTFGTMTQDLLELSDWLESCGVTHVAMESTGVLWKPIYNLLEGLGLILLVVNAHHIKSVPGRKTDMKDAEWIAKLLQHGLLRGSYIPDRPNRELRELVRYRRSLIQQRAQAVNRIQKVLEGANIKLSSVASDITGVSGRAMLEAISSGQDDPDTLVSLAKGRLQSKRAELKQALRGLTGRHQRLLIQSLLRQLDFLANEVASLDREIADRMVSCEEAIKRIDTIPGVGRRTAEELMAEIGLDMSRFPSAAHLASWARICPGNNESAGKRKSSHIGQGNRWLRSALVEAARATAHTKNNYLSAQYHRLAARRGSNRATIALAHTILVTIYYMLVRGTSYHELGGNYFDERNEQAAIKRAVNRIEQLGYKVTLEMATA
jgi:transposase